MRLSRLDILLLRCNGFRSGHGIIVCLCLSLQIRKMDLEARTLPPAQKAILLAKLREYKSDLNTLKREVKKSATDSLSTRDDLLESGLLDQQYTGVKYSSSSISRCISISSLRM